MGRIEINNKVYNLYINQEKDLYIFDLTNNDDVNVMQVKAEIENKYNIVIKTFFKGCYKRYAKDNYKESNDYSFVFLTK